MSNRNSDRILSALEKLELAVSEITTQPLEFLNIESPDCECKASDCRSELAATLKLCQSRQADSEALLNDARRELLECGFAVPDEWLGLVIYGHLHRTTNDDGTVNVVLEKLATEEQLRPIRTAVRAAIVRAKHEASNGKAAGFFRESPEAKAIRREASRTRFQDSQQQRIQTHAAQAAQAYASTQKSTSVAKQQAAHLRELAALWQTQKIHYDPFIDRASACVFTAIAAGALRSEKNAGLQFYFGQTYGAFGVWNFLYPSWDEATRKDRLKDAEANAALVAAEAIDNDLPADPVRGAGNSALAETVVSSADSPKRSASPSREMANRLYEYACTTKECELSPGEAWLYLKHHGYPGQDDCKLPNRKTFINYVYQHRNAANGKTRQPRAGRTGRSVVKKSDL